MTKCKVCRSEFVKRSMTHKCCTPECAEIFGREQTKKQVAKKEREETKVRKEKLKPHRHFLDLTQRVVNKYVLTKFKDLPCVACGKSPYDGVRNASHFKSRGSNSFLRFNLWNIWPCCYSCNVKKGGNIHEMRKGLIGLIGMEKLEFLENSPRIRIYEKEYLERMRRIFAKKTRRISSARSRS